MYIFFAYALDNVEIWIDISWFYVYFFVYELDNVDFNVVLITLFKKNNLSIFNTEI